MTAKPPPRPHPSPLGARPAIGKGKVLLTAERAARGLRTRRPVLHPGIVQETQARRVTHPPVSHFPDIPLSEMLASSSPPGGSQPPATYVPPGSSVGWLHGVGQAVTPGPAMANTGLYLREAAGKAKARTGAAWHFCSGVSTTIPKVR